MVFHFEGGTCCSSADNGADLLTAVVAEVEVMGKDGCLSLFGRQVRNLPSSFV